MSTFNDDNMTIYDAMLRIENQAFVMPAFQRQYVWSLEQIEKLWDSILLGYPIATFLFWHIDSSNITEDTYFCNFLKDVTFNNRKQADSINYELSGVHPNNTNIAVLDGQQRLTSLYVSLFGNVEIRPKYARKNNSGMCSRLFIELNRNKIVTDEDEYDSKKFDIRFSEKIGKLSPTQFEIKTILNKDFQNDSTLDFAISQVLEKVPSDSKDYARNILKTLHHKIFKEKLIRYTEIEGMKQDDALEMFVRFNSGGKALRKSEITMSILEAYWPKAKHYFGSILTDTYQGFGTDFIIRTALMLYGDVVKSSISKTIADDLKNNWTNFIETLLKLSDLLGEMKIEVNRFASSWNVLLPIIYCIYYNPDYKNNIDGIKSYLIRAILFTYFQSGTTGKLQQIKSNINSNDFEITIEMLDQMNDLRVTEGRIEDVINSEKGGRVAGEALYFLSMDWYNRNFKYEQDHLHPYDRFDSPYPASVSNADWKLWRSNRNRLPNLHLLEGRSNGSKSNMRLVDYYNDMNFEQQENFKQHSLIPENVSLEIEHFGEFYEKRKQLIKNKLITLLGVKK